VSGVDDLVQWLRDQLDEDEQVAREATPGPWRNAPTPRHRVTASGRSEEAVFASPPDVGATVVATTGEAVERRHLVDAEHIARHDPARVLREIDAKRKLLAAYAEVAANDVDESYEYAYGWANGLGHAVRLLAEAYADRPGYREEWRP
jgi:hypothetical protein